jgi:hypothetical protein
MNDVRLRGLGVAGREAAGRKSPHNHAQTAQNLRCSLRNAATGARLIEAEVLDSKSATDVASSLADALEELQRLQRRLDRRIRRDQEGSEEPDLVPSGKAPLGHPLRDLAAMADLDFATSEVSAVPSADENSVDLFLVIDQLDESPIIQHLARKLRNALAGRDASRLRMVVGCRTAEYPSELTDSLRSQGLDCVLADLAPLTREEAVRLASSADGMNGEDLVAAAVEAGAGVLANVPLTLDLLVRTYRQAGRLDASPTKLFAQGVTQLVEEHDQVRRLADYESTVEQRLAVSGRIAARLLLSGRRTIWRGSVLESGEQDLNADWLVGGYERGISGPFPVTKKIVSETLATALLTGRGSNRLAFRHASFTAYLTARYLMRFQPSS